MAWYYVCTHPQTNGNHEIHRDGCPEMPSQKYRTYLGDYASCKPAANKAKASYPHINGCTTCSPECHSC